MKIELQEFLTWLRQQPDDREFGAESGTCPLACYVRETEKVDAYVTNGVLNTPDLRRVEVPPGVPPPVFFSHFTVWKQQVLPKWAQEFEKLWDGPLLRGWRGALSAPRAQLLAWSVGLGDAS